ncbi:helix-turn-helix domain-containing protein [Weissella viridescens]
MTTLDRIKQVAKQRGYSLTQVNEKANLGKNTIYSWKTKEPGLNNLKAVADVLGVSVDYLLGNTDEMHPAQSNIVSINNKNIELKDLLDPEQIEQRTVSYDGQPISDHDMKLIQTILEQMAKGEN